MTPTTRAMMEKLANNKHRAAMRRACASATALEAVALFRVSSRLGGRRIRVERLRREPVLAGHASLCSATVPCAPVTSPNHCVSPCRVAAMDYANEGPRQTCPGDPSFAPHFIPQTNNTHQESELLRWNTFFLFGGACRRSVHGNRAATLRNDLARARVRGATHLSYLTDRC